MTPTDPRDLLCDDDGDVVVPLQHSRGLAGVKQAIRIALLLVRGEWFLNLDAGVPYFTDILGQKFNATKVRAAFRDAILGVEDVAELLSLEMSLDPATRVLSVSWRARVAFGGTVADDFSLEAA